MQRGSTPDHLADPAVVLCLGVSAAQYAEIARSVGPRATVVVAPDNTHARQALLAVAGLGVRSDQQLPVPRAAEHAPAAHRMITRGDLHIDLDRREAVFDQVTLDLPARSFDLLSTLAHDPARTWTFADLTERVWHRRFLGDTEAVVSAVKRLRRHLSRQAPQMRIESVRGIGFRLQCGQLLSAPGPLPV